MRRAPLPFRRRGLRRDTITLVPASQLPFKEHWTPLARSAQTRQALFVVPHDETRLKQAMRRLVPELRARGRRVIAFPEHA